MEGLLQGSTSEQVYNTQKSRDELVNTDLHENSSNEIPKIMKDYKSEYKKNFLPFSQYDYIDGKFFKKKSSQESESPWYKEVIELRQKAGEYKFRGWGGTELGLGTTVVVPAFNHQLWKHVSHKSSFNALALITTTSKAITKKDKSKDSFGGGNNPPGASGQKPGPRRPNTATPKHPLNDPESRAQHQRDEEHAHGKTQASEAKSVKKFVAQSKGRSQSAEPGLRYKRTLPAKQHGGEKENVPGGVSMRGGRGETDGHADGATPKVLPNKNLRPTTLTTSPRTRSSGSSHNSNQSSNKPPSSVSAREQTKSTIRQHFNKGSVDRSLDGTDEIVVKSPPEPTRVKSPEQVKLMSPEPVNWMDTLDTTKGFTVTQSIPQVLAGTHTHVIGQT